MFRLVIKSYKDPDYAHLISQRSTAQQLARTEDGANINLNHEQYYTLIEEYDDPDES